MTRLASVLVLLLLTMLPAGAAERFVAGIDDLPLMAGLDPVTSDSVAFDSPGGRIVTAFARGKSDRATVTQFYATTLPQLGWKPAGDGAFVREGENLKLDFAETPPVLTVRFTLSPLSTEKRGG